MSKKSQVWLISQQSTLGNVKAEIKKELLFEYMPNNGEPLFLPIGHVIYHEDSFSYEDYDDYQVQRNIVPYPVYTVKQISKLEGELLTLADTSFTDREQREAFKSILRRTLWGFNKIQERKLQEMFIEENE